jgi:peptidoglycan hydrolase-like protein with peptidoglycan-binding domain
MARTTRRTIGAALAVALTLVAPLNAWAQLAPPASPAADPVYDSQKAAFDALPESDRRAIQDSLVWSGQYLGVVDGVFGKRTRDAIVAYEASIRAPTNGIVDAAQLSGMTGAAQKARAAVRFQTFTDEKTGVKIGAPLKILDKRVAIESGGVRLTKADGSITLDLSSLTGGDAKMGVLYAALIAEASGKKISLKVSRPDFFVVSGEEAGRKFYQRVAKAPAGWTDPSAIRGFRLVYPAAQSADYDRIGVAIADSFDPFPAAAAPSTPNALSAQTTASAPSRPILAATGFLIAPGQVLSVISAADCPNPTIDGNSSKFLRDDREAGLSLLTKESGASASAPALIFGALGPDLVALSYTAQEPNGRVALDVTSASPFAASSGQTRPTLLASLSRGAQGAPVFDRTGALVALIASSPSEPKLVAGVAPTALHGMIGAEQIQQFLSLAPDSSGAPASNSPLVAGQIAAAERGSVVAISCRR